MYKYKNKYLPLLKTAIFQGLSRATSIPSWPAHRRAPGTMCLGPILQHKKCKRPHPGTQILSQILEGGIGNRGQMPQICPGSPLGLNIDRCISYSVNKYLSLQVTIKHIGTSLFKTYCTDVVCKSTPE